mmetsp:Transcript_16498/g.46962  ORF Transcript_16498/g.46962 Transcript_16498/m.46962 type:complete len:109 (+) Transcript_16498:48-374(+)
MPARPLREASGLDTEHRECVSFAFWGGGSREVAGEGASAAARPDPDDLDDCKGCLSGVRRERFRSIDEWGKGLSKEHRLDVHGVGMVSTRDITTHGVCMPQGMRKRSK